jgi:predicted XRE-type DNA-binding protein
MSKIEGGTNVFSDLSLPDADELLAKAQLASAISDIIDERRLTQAAAADLLGTTQPQVSNLVRGRLDGFSLERLARFLNRVEFASP